MNKSSKLVYGIGTKGMTYPTTVGGKFTREYRLWKSMLYRCTERLLDKFPSYTGAICSENFKSYSYFYEWCQNQTGFKNRDEKGKSWQLDKDLLLKANKFYSEDTCVFVPARINSLIIKCDATRGELPVGIYWKKKNSKFCAQCADGSDKKKHLGLFNTPQEAFLAYKTYKEALIKEVANEYKDQLDCRVYEALMNYEVNEND